MPLEWSADDCELDAVARECVDLCRHDLWRHGVRGYILERMAFEFGYVLYMGKLKKP